MRDEEILSAFFDGEPVDPDELQRALAHADAPALLADMVRLRRAARDVAMPLPSSLASVRAERPWWKGGAVPLPAVAALLLLVFVASLFLPRPWQVDGQSDPPRASRAITFEPGVDWHPTQ